MLPDFGRGRCLKTYKLYQKILVVIIFVFSYNLPAEEKLHQYEGLLLSLGSEVAWSRFYLKSDKYFPKRGIKRDYELEGYLLRTEFFIGYVLTKNIILDSGAAYEESYKAYSGLEPYADSETEPSFNSFVQWQIGMRYYFDVDWYIPIHYEVLFGYESKYKYKEKGSHFEISDCSTYQGEGVAVGLGREYWLGENIALGVAFLHRYRRLEVISSTPLECGMRSRAGFVVTTGEHMEGSRIRYNSYGLGISISYDL